MFSVGDGRTSVVPSRLGSGSTGYTVVTVYSRGGSDLVSMAKRHARLLKGGDNVKVIDSLEQAVKLAEAEKVGTVVIHTDSCVLGGCNKELTAIDRPQMAWVKWLRRGGRSVQVVRYCECPKLDQPHWSVSHRDIFGTPVAMSSIPPVVYESDVVRGSPDPLLTIVVVDDSEKDINFLCSYLDSIWHLNREGIVDSQFIIISQRLDLRPVYQVVSGYPFEVDVIAPHHPVVGGYPVWDVCDSLNRVWSLIRGEYLSVDHTEFFWSKDRLARTIQYLRHYRPWIALGNLRRLGKGLDNWRVTRSDSSVALIFDQALEARDWDSIAQLCETIPTHWWCWSLPEPSPDRKCWDEDQFYIRKEWFERVAFFQHTERQAFQDIYDLLGAAWREMDKRGVAPECARLSLDQHKCIHRAHALQWGSWTPQMRDWFMSRLDQWQGTAYARPEAWESLFNAPDCLERDNAVWRLREGPQGTLNRFMVKFRKWLDSQDFNKLYWAKYSLAVSGGRDDVKLDKLVEPNPCVPDKWKHICRLYICSATATTCGADCPYCFLDHDAFYRMRTHTNEQEWAAWERLAEDYGPCFVLLSGLEPLDNLPLVAGILKYHYAQVNTNLTFHLPTLEKLIPPDRLDIHPSFHPHLWGLKIEPFLDKVDKVRKLGFDVPLIALVGYPPYLRWWDSWIQKIKDMGIMPNPVPMRQIQYQGKWYPGGYTKEELEILNRHVSPDIFCADGNVRPLNIRACDAGRLCCYIAADGAVSRCGQTPGSMGDQNFFRDGKIIMNTKPEPCDQKECLCGNLHAFHIKD